MLSILHAKVWDLGQSSHTDVSNPCAKLVAEGSDFPILKSTLESPAYADAWPSYKVCDRSKRLIGALQVLMFLLGLTPDSVFAHRRFLIYSARGNCEPVPEMINVKIHSA